MSTTAAFVEQFDALFTGRRDVYALGYPDKDNPVKFRYRAVDGDLTAAVLLQHLQGTECVGVYPIVDDKVTWFAVDFDAPKEAVEDPFGAAWEAAKVQAAAFEAEGLVVYLERSRSGQGVHVWGFLSEPLNAGVVREALKPLLVDKKIFTSKDRMYPVQAATTGVKDGYGNLIALPFYGAAVKLGNSSFLDSETMEVINPRVWLAAVIKNSSTVVQNLARTAEQTKVTDTGTRLPRGVPNGDPSQQYRPTRPITGALKLISHYGCQFMRHAWVDRRTLSEPEWYAAIQQASCFQEGLQFAHALSRDYKRYNPADVEAKYEQALRNPPVGCAWIQEHYPEQACGNCPMKAPYHLAKQSVLELVRAAAEPMEGVGTVKADLERVRKLDSRELSAGVPWGLPTLDEYTRLRPSEMTVVGAMQSIGKTAFMVDTSFRIAEAGTPVFVFSAETGRTSLRQRYLARASEVDSMALRGERRSGPLSPEEWTRLNDGAAQLEKLPLFFDYTSLTADDVIRQVEQTLLREGIPLDAEYVIFFDYLQFGSKKSGDDSEYDRLSRLSSEFKFVAKILERPVVVFSQLQREREGGEDPLLTWFKGTGRIESDMDVGIIITGERVEGACAPRTVHIVKQREGPAGVRIEFTLQQQFSRFDGWGQLQTPAPQSLLTSEDDQFGKAV